MNGAENKVDTLPKLLKRNFHDFKATSVAMRRKKLGIWNEYTWKDYYEHVMYFALGLLSFGFKKGDRLPIIGDNAPEWYWAELAAISLGGIPFGIYVDCNQSEIKYYMEHSDATFVVAYDQEQVDKVLHLKNEIPDMKKIIYWEPKGLWDYDDSLVMNFSEIEKAGIDYEKQHPGLFEEMLEKVTSEDIILFCYTSGTTGLPKAAMISNKSLIETINMWKSAENVGKGENYFSYISPSWVTEQILGIAMGLDRAWVINFPEKAETVQQDLREIGPKRLFYGARLWEGVASMIQAKIAETTFLKHFLYDVSLNNVGYPMAKCLQEKRKPSVFLKAFNALMWLLVFHPLKNKIGLSKLKVGYTAGAAIAPAVMELFHIFGIHIKNLYGSTEMGVISLHRDGDVRFESVGKLFEKAEVKISEQGEILVKAPSLFIGYYKDEEATRKAFNKDGWYCSGDAGHIDESGHLIYYDRVNELIKLPDGSNFSPQFIEVRLRFSPYIKDVIAICGKQRPFLSAIINIDYANVGKWAEKNHISYTTYTDLSQKPEVRQLVKGAIDNINKIVPDSAKIKKFINLHKEFDPDEEELTRTRKLKRAFLEKRYQEIIEAMYGHQETLNVRTAVSYSDGRKGTSEAEVFLNIVG